MFLEIAKQLTKEDIETTLCFDSEKNQFFWNLNTDAKSHLYLYEDLTLCGRYGYTSRLDYDTIEENLEQLCYEFRNCLHGRDYGSGYWFDFCRKLNVKILT